MLGMNLGFTASRMLLPALTPIYTNASPTQQSNIVPAEFDSDASTIVFKITDSDFADVSGEPVIISIQNGTATNDWIFLQKRSDSRLRLFVRAQGVTETFDGFISGLPSEGTIKVAIGWNASDFRVWINGALYATIDGNFSRPTGLNTIGIGQVTGTGFSYTGGTISNIEIYDGLLSDAKGRGMTGNVQVLSGITFDPTKDLYVMAGQSNSVGQAPGTATYTNTSNIFNLGNDMVMGAYSDPYADPSGSKIKGLDDTSGEYDIGYAGYFADALHNLVGEDIAVVPANLSSQALVDGGYDPLTSAYRTSGSKIVGLRGTAFAVVNQIAMAKQFAPIKAIIWGQGESDVRDGASEANYTAKLQTLMAELRGATGNNTVPWFNIGMPAFGAAYLATQTEYDDIIDAQIAVAAADSNAYYVSGNTVAGDTNDGLHYGLAGNATVGDNTAEAVAEHIYGVSV